MRLFLSADGRTGFALNGDDIVSVFNAPGSASPGASFASMMLAVSEGGRRLDNFDTALPTIYGAAGFVPVARLKWDEKQKPKDWDKGVFKNY